MGHDHPVTRLTEPGLRIEDYAVVGDLQTMALVGNNGSVDWLCLPRFDSAATFSSLLGGEDNGRWQICPSHLADGAVRRTSRRYRGESLVLETTWETDSGAVTLIDAMPPRDGGVKLVRRVECTSGEVEMSVRWVIRFAYGAATPWVRRLGDDQGGPGLLAIAGPDAVVLRGYVLPEPDRRGRNRAHHQHFTLKAGQHADYSMVWFPSHADLPPPPDVADGIARTEEFWREWISRCTYSGPYAEAVRRSLLILKAMTYEPTGGIVAAPTTSLPEQIGGARNWDYRYCWLRDATLVIGALVQSGHIDEAGAWRDWLLRAVAGAPEELQIMYGLAGERTLPELELAHLSGYEGSRPVRIGNEASSQFQLDVFGEVMAALHISREAGLPANAFSWSVQRAGLRHLETVMDRPDSGLWEVRGPARHFTHSKVMVWVAFDRAVQGFEKHGLPGPVDHWRVVRDRVHAEICDQGWNAELGAFTQSYGGTALDAALLVMPIVGFLPGDDPRVVSTVAAIEKGLRHGPLVDRYDTSEGVDGLAPGEGSFLACSFWLVSALAMCDRVPEATALFEELLELRNDVGLLAEEYDGGLRRMAGNFPQAFSHLALVEAAHILEREGGVSRAAGGDTNHEGEAEHRGAARGGH